METYQRKSTFHLRLSSLWMVSSQFLFPPNMVDLTRGFLGKETMWQHYVLYQC